MAGCAGGDCGTPPPVSFNAAPPAHTPHPPAALLLRSTHNNNNNTAQEKWSATAWIRVARHQPRDAAGRALLAPPPPPDCRDDDEMCAEWAFFGECAKNPGFMRAGCRLSCGACRREGEERGLGAGLEEGGGGEAAEGQAAAGSGGGGAERRQASGSLAAPRS